MLVPESLEEALDHLCRLHAIVKKGRGYLTARLNDPTLAVPTDTAIAVPPS